MTADQLAPKPMPDDVPRELPPPITQTKRTSALEERVVEAISGEQLELSVTVAHDDDGGIVLQLLRAIGQGRITTFAEREQVREQLLEERAAAVRAAIEPVRKAVVALGGEARPAVHQYRIGVTLPVDKIASLEALPEVELIGLETFQVGPASFQDRLRLSGYDVTAGAAGCGSNSMKVYYAWFYEDSARDDADGPDGSRVETE